MARKTLSNQLNAKLDELRNLEDSEKAASAAFLTASERAAEKSATASSHAAAVDQAIYILEQAGVDL